MVKVKYINEPTPNISYRKRPGSYAIIKRSTDDLIGIIMANGEYFLLGGGIEKEETTLKALERETSEEIGYTLKQIIDLAEIGSYIYNDEKGYLDVEAYIHVAVLGQKICEPIEKDHNLIWVNPTDYIGKMSQLWQDEALKKYLEFKKTIRR